MNSDLSKLFLGGGCFWCVEAVFSGVHGVSSTMPGYMGGEVKNPSYEDVCSGLTGHAEVIEISYEKKSIDLKNILELFFNTHDPTTLNRQGADVGSQYRSVIFCCNREQYKICEGYINDLNTMKTFHSSVVTELHLISQKELAVTDSNLVNQIFWQAERMHQNYFNDNISAPYCELVIKPKIEKRNEILKKL